MEYRESWSLHSLFSQAARTAVLYGDVTKSMNARCFAFGPFVLIPQRRVLLKRETPVRIGNRASDILVQLVQRSGEVIDKLELMALVWAGIFVDKSNLNVNIAAIRRVIDYDFANRSCIATVVGRGYHFVEPVPARSAP
jgi:DNA-binding winged helix-turn-helix (wHTH) protein